MGKVIPMVLFAICLVFLERGPGIAQEHGEGLGKPSLLQQQPVQSPSWAVRQAKLMKVDFRAFDCVGRVPRKEAQATRGLVETFCQRIKKAGVFVGLIIPLGVISSAKTTRKNPAYKSRAEVPVIRRVGFPQLRLSFGERSQ